MLTIVSRGHSHHLDFISWLQRRGCAANDTPSFKRKLQGIVKIVVPAHRLFLRVMRIHNDFPVDALFTRFIFGWASHLFPPDIHKDQESTKRYHLTLCR